MLELDPWRGEGTLVTDRLGAPLLWIDDEDRIVDAAGEIWEPLDEFDGLAGLALLVGEWLWCAPRIVDYCDIHPWLRDRVARLVSPRVLMPGPAKIVN
jgi:hypothetical protein